MKLRNIFLALTTAILITSCNSFIEDDETKTGETTAVTFNINSSYSSSNSGRMAIPTYTNEGFTYSMVVTNLDSPEYSFTVENENKAVIASRKYKLYVGDTYNIEVVAYKNGEKILTGENKNLKISKNTKNVNVSMVAVPGAMGTLRAVCSVDTSNQGIPVSFQIFKMEDYLSMQTDAYKIESTEDEINCTEDEDDWKLYTYEKQLVEGTYFIICKQREVVYSEQVVIQAGLVTTVNNEYKPLVLKLHVNQNEMEIPEDVEPLYAGYNSQENFFKIAYYDDYEDYLYMLEPKKSGYCFAGWYLDKECSKPVYSEDFHYYFGSVDLYPKWINPYSEPVVIVGEDQNVYYTTNLVTPSISPIYGTHNYIKNLYYTSTPDNSAIFYISHIDGDNGKVYKSTRNADDLEIGSYDYNDDKKKLEAISCTSDNKLFIAYTDYSVGVKISMDVYSFNETSWSPIQTKFAIEPRIEEGHSYEQINNIAIDNDNKLIYLAYESTIYDKNKGAFFTKNYIQVFKYTIEGEFITIESVDSAKISTSPAEDCNERVQELIYDKNLGILMTTKTDSVFTSRKEGNNTVFNSYGKIYKLNYDETTGVISSSEFIGFDRNAHNLNGDTNASTTIHLNDVNALNSLTDTSGLLGAQKIVAITPKKLVVADGGGFIYEGADGKLYGSCGVRIVEIDLAEKLITYICSSDIGDPIYGWDIYSGFFSKS